MLKAYYEREMRRTPSSSMLVTPILVDSERTQEDDVADDYHCCGVRLENSVVLNNLDSHLKHLPMFPTRGCSATGTKISLSIF